VKCRSVCDVQRQMSGGNIKISDDRDSVDSRCVSVCGPTEAVQAARQLITGRYAIHVLPSNLHAYHGIEAN